MDRREKLLHGLRLDQSTGAEIGALASPVVRREDGDILYVDHLATPGLKAKYRDHANVEVEAIVDVDAVWADRTLAEALGARAPVDYVIASHVVEHAPDLVAWLGELQSVLAPGGTIRLAIPDKRFCFDYLRAETRLSDVLTAHFVRARRPQLHELIDSELNHRDVDLGEAWEGRVDLAPLVPPPSLDHAYAIAERASRGEYIDVHCWTFTPASFAGIMQQLCNLGLSSLGCVAHFDTEPLDMEFFMVLGPAAQADAVASWGDAKAALSGGDGDGAAVPERARQAARITDLQDRLSEAQAEVAALRASTSWRVTGPLRALGGGLRGLRRRRSGGGA